MKKYSIKKNVSSLIVSVLILLQLSCTNEPRSIGGIYVSELLLISAEQKYSYSNLVEKSLKKDISSLKKISTLMISDAAGYDHGTVLVGIITSIGEKEYIKLVGTLTNEEKRNLISYLEVGIEYGDEQYKGKTLEEVFPLLTEYLKA
jgi:hypothetical protein